MESLLIIYDGACPFCSAYVSLLRLRSDFRVELLSARSDDARVADYRSRGYRLDEGMLVVLNQTIYVGAEAMHVLAVLSDSTGWLNRLQRAVFMRRWLSRCLYPLLRAGRRVALWLRRVPLIDAARPGQ
jgi:predicted DCC family thiol-disulfide oxidoreductase YuxK